MPELIRWLFSEEGFMPHGHCYLWRAEVVALHVVSDTLIALAYLSIPVTLWYFVRRRPDVPFRGTFLAFGLFIVSCGITHALEVWTLWEPRYWLSGCVKALTAVSSVLTATALVTIVPKALALRSPAELSRANAALIKSEARFRAAIDGMVDAFFLLDAVRSVEGTIIDFRITDVNAAALPRTCASRDTLVGSLVSTLTAPELGAAMLATYARVAETQKAEAVEVKLAAGRGEGDGTKLRWLLQEVVPLQDGVAVTSRDVTARRRSQEFMLRNTSEGVCLIAAATGEIVFANAPFETMLGYTPGELEGRPARVLSLDVADLDAQPGVSEGEIETRSGGRVPCRTTITELLHPEHGRVWLVTRTDIREAKAAAETVARLASIVASTNDAITSKSIAGVLETWNAGAERLYGYRACEVIGMDNAVLVPPELREEERSLVERVARGERVEVLETVRVHKAGRRIDVSLTASPIQTPGGPIVGISSIARDISGRKADERALQASLREKSVLLAEVHHRVKNNLQVVSSLLKLHAEKVTDPVAHRAFRDSQERVRSIALLHETIYQSEDLGAVAVDTYARSLVNAIVHAHAPRGVGFHFGGSGALLAMDEAAPFGLILNELLTNALKHAFPADDAAAPEVQISVRTVGDDVELVVRDNGVGYPPGFDVAGADGLGMYLVRALTEQLEGAIEFRSTGAGAEARLTFPSRNHQGGPK